VYDSDVELTTAPDMFTLDDEEDGQRAKMPCGHAISTTLLVLWVFNAIFNNISVTLLALALHSNLHEVYKLRSGFHRSVYYNLQLTLPVHLDLLLLDLSLKTINKLNFAFTNVFCPYYIIKGGLDF
jgi:hypothetical protein